MPLSAIVPGKIAPSHMLANIPNIVSAYYSRPFQLRPVEFGTSGHRGSSLKGSFNEMHIESITQAICNYRSANNITGPLFMGFDTHALSIPAFKTALSVLAANNIEVIIHKNDEFTPTPVISHQILAYNKGRTEGMADGIVITSSHNGPADGGFKYNPTHGGPADVDVTKLIENMANGLIDQNNSGVSKMPYEKARASATTHEKDFIALYVDDLAAVIDFDAIRESGISIGADPMGGASVHFWKPIAQKYGLNITVVNPAVDPRFGFMHVDSDSTIRMDCSSSDAMGGLLSIKQFYDISFGNDPDADRHGIVTKTGLMNPNHYLSVAIWYLMQNRPAWRTDLKVGKTLVSSSMIDSVVKGLGKQLYEVPVGFKWFVPGLLDGSVAFGGEESAGASFLRKDGTVWTSDKDGITLSLLAAEILAKTGKTPQEIYDQLLVPQYGNPYYRRADGDITDQQKAFLKALKPESITETSVAGINIAQGGIITTAPGNNAPMGGVKVSLVDGSWFALRPSGTEPKMKVYVESFGGRELWQRIYDEAVPLIFGKQK